MIEQERVIAEPLAVLQPRPYGLAGLGHVLRRFARRRTAGAVAGAIVALFLLLAIGAPLVARYDPVATQTAIKLQPPSASHIFGTDDLGRDVFSRTLYGAQISLGIGFGGMALSLIVSVTIAVISGYFGGVTDLVIQRVVDAFQAVPGLLIILTVVTIIKPTVFNLILLLGIQAGIGQSRIIRSQVLVVKVMPFVDASRCVGASHLRIMMRDILPNILGITIVIGSIALFQIILAEATLDFLGFGVQPPWPTWGQMLSGSARPFMVRAPWMGLAPGLALSVTVLAVNFLGDALRDELDPRLRGATN